MRKRKGVIRRKKGRKGIMEEAGLKNIPSEAYCPLQICSPIQFHQWAGLGNNTTPTEEELGKNKTLTNGERRPTITRRTSCSDAQTMKLHHVRTPTLSKRGRRSGAEYDTDRRREAIIYKETWKFGKPCSLFRFSIGLH